jgi:hypothetical protein
LRRRIHLYLAFRPLYGLSARCHWDFSIDMNGGQRRELSRTAGRGSQGHAEVLVHSEPRSSSIRGPAPSV